MFEVRQKISKSLAADLAYLAFSPGIVKLYIGFAFHKEIHHSEEYNDDLYRPTS